MKACVLHAMHDLRYEDVPEPVISEPKELLVRTLVAGICGSDMHYYDEGGIGSLIRVREPIIIGHEGIGVVEKIGSGVTGDLLAHSIDTAEWINGPIKKVTAYTEVFIKERKNTDTGEMEKITIDDACMFLAVFENGSIGTFESTRYARGRKNYSTMEINGEKGAVAFNLETPEYLDFFRYADPDTGGKVEDHLTGWQKILVTNAEHPYMGKYWVPGTTIGYEHTFINALADFLLGTVGLGPKYAPDMRGAMRTQKVCDAVLKSAASGQWVEI